MKPTWLLRRKAGALLAKADRDPSAANLQELERWRNANPRQSAIMASGEALLRQSERLPSSAMAGGRNASRRHDSQLALAASVPILLASASAIYILSQSGSRSVEAVLLTTKVGEIRQVPLSDGSTVILDTATRVRVEIGKNRRQAILEDGRARFAIAPRKSPFTVLTATTSVRAAGGVIDVSNYGGSPDIELIAGRAKIELQTQGEREALVVQAPSSINAVGGTMHALAGGQSSNWPSGRLSFSNARLSDVIAASNRYTSTKIKIADPVVGELRVTGVFKAGDGDGLSKTLAAALGLNVSRDQTGSAVLTTTRERGAGDR